LARSAGPGRAISRHTPGPCPPSSPATFRLVAGNLRLPIPCAHRWPSPWLFLALTVRPHPNMGAGERRAYVRGDAARDPCPRLAHGVPTTGANRAVQIGGTSVRDTPPERDWGGYATTGPDGFQQVRFPPAPPHHRRSRHDQRCRDHVLITDSHRAPDRGHPTGGVCCACGGRAVARVITAGDEWGTGADYSGGGSLVADPGSTRDKRDTPGPRSCESIGGPTLTRSTEAGSGAAISRNTPRSLSAGPATFRLVAGNLRLHGDGASVAHIMRK
jgi:hypothetical protein